jgi:hypothetical protein
MTPKIEKNFLESRKMKLSFAVSLLDDYSKEKPIGQVNVSLKDRTEKPIKNPSSYYLFLELPDDTYTVQVRSDYYFDMDSETINPAELDPKNPIVNITLKPNPSYPFPPGATLIRGMVYDTAGEAVSGAQVRIQGRDIENKTTEKGEFVLHLKSLTEDEIIKEGGKRFVKGNGDKIIHLEIEYDEIIKTIEAEAEEGKTTSVIV